MPVLSLLDFEGYFPLVLNQTWSLEFSLWWYKFEIETDKSRTTSPVLGRSVSEHVRLVPRKKDIEGLCINTRLKFLIAILGKANNEVGLHWKERSLAGLYYRDLKHSDALFYMWQVGLYHTWQNGSKQFSVRLAKYFPFESNEIQTNQIISTFWYRKLRKFWWYFLLNLRHTFTKHFLMLPFHDFLYQLHHHKGIVDRIPPFLLTKRHTMSHAELSLFSLVLFLCNLA